MNHKICQNSRCIILPIFQSSRRPRQTLFAEGKGRMNGCMYNIELGSITCPENCLMSTLSNNEYSSRETLRNRTLLLSHTYRTAGYEVFLLFHDISNLNIYIKTQNLVNINTFLILRLFT